MVNVTSFVVPFAVATCFPFRDAVTVAWAAFPEVAISIETVPPILGVIFSPVM